MTPRAPTPPDRPCPPSAPSSAVPPGPAPEPGTAAPGPGTGTGPDSAAGSASGSGPVSGPGSASGTGRHGIRAAWIMLASGWSGNQFSALLGAYRTESGLSESTVTGLFALYVVGLAPGLLLGGPLADRTGRRPVALLALALNLLSTCMLMVGAAHPAWLLAGRFVTGVSAGALLAAGSAWIKELSAGAAEHTAARRAGLFVSGGFATGGLVAALIAQWAPHPMVTAYLPHLALTLAAGVAALPAPETLPGRATGRTPGHAPRRPPEPPHPDGRAPRPRRPGSTPCPPGPPDPPGPARTSGRATPSPGPYCRSRPGCSPPRPSASPPCPGSSTADWTAGGPCTRASPPPSSPAAGSSPSRPDDGWRPGTPWPPRSPPW